MEQRELSWGEYVELSYFAESKYNDIEDPEMQMQAIHEFIGTYINGGKFVVYNGRDQLLAYFDILDDAIAYIEENEPKNELFSIECKILN